MHMRRYQRYRQHANMQPRDHSRDTNDREDTTRKLANEPTLPPPTRAKSCVITRTAEPMATATHVPKPNHARLDAPERFIAAYAPDQPYRRYTNGTTDYTTDDHADTPPHAREVVRSRRDGPPCTRSPTTPTPGRTISHARDAHPNSNCTRARASTMRVEPIATRTKAMDMQSRNHAMHATSDLLARNTPMISPMNLATEPMTARTKPMLKRMTSSDPLDCALRRT